MEEQIMAYMTHTRKDNVTTMRTPKQYKSVVSLAQDLGWTPQRLAGFCQRTCGQPEPRTQRACQQVYQGLEQLLIRLMTPYWSAFDRLIQTLLPLRGEMTPWERDRFLPDIARRRQQKRFVSPAMIKKVREIAHKYGVPCGFPRLIEMAQAADAQRTPAAQTPRAANKERSESHAKDERIAFKESQRQQRRQKM